MKKENIKFKIVFILLIYTYLIVSNLLLQKMIRISEITYNRIILIWSNLIFYFVLGILLTIPFFLSEAKKKGKWEINYKYLLTFILPLVIIVFSYFYPVSLDFFYLVYISEYIINALAVVSGYSLIFIISKKE
ncbi:MAG: hypothetical protein PWQ23_979 [Thermoanaerobacter sp.]|jgi:hypothetical protein|nr:hypothetical protein [Thermoanaerobacter sp.]